MMDDIVISEIPGERKKEFLPGRCLKSCRISLEISRLLTSTWIK